MALALVALTIAGSALGAVLVRGDLLTGRPAATAIPLRDCSAVPPAEPDATPFLPGNALDTVLGRIPYPSVPDLAEVRILGYREYDTPARYVRFTRLMSPSAVRNAMATNGLVAVHTIGYEAGETFFGVEAMRFASPQAAAVYARTVLLADCENGVASSVRPVPGLTGGAMFTYHQDRRPPFRASFLVGDTAVRANLCICREVALDPYQVLASWAQEIAFWMRGPAE